MYILPVFIIQGMEKNEGEIDFSRQKLKEFFASQPVPQETLRTFFRQKYDSR